jgi:hypothetical protein
MLQGSLLIASNRFFGSPITCATTELPNEISQQWLDTLCWIADKKSAPFQFLSTGHMYASTYASSAAAQTHPEGVICSRSFYQFTVESLIMVSIILSTPGFIWRMILEGSRYNLGAISMLIAAAKQSTGSQKKTNIQSLATHIERARRYYRLHWTFDEDLRRRLTRLR